MVRSLKTALMLSLVVVAGQAFGAGSVPTTALVSYLESTKGYAKFESLIASPEKLAQVQNFIRGSGVRQAQITEALKAVGAERASKFRSLMEEALSRAASDTALASRVNKAAQTLIGVSDAELEKVASLKLGGGAQGGRAELTREMPGGKFGPPMPPGPFDNPQAAPALIEELAQVEKAEGGSLPVGFENAVRDPEVPGEGMFDACLKADGKPLEAAPRHVLEKMIAAGDKVPVNVKNRDVAVTEAAIEVGMRERFVDRDEEIDAVDTLANQCGYLGSRYVRGIALIRAGAI